MIIKMSKLSILFFSFILIAQVLKAQSNCMWYSDSSCDEKIIKILEMDLKSTFGEQWIRQKVNKKNKLVINFTLDSLGKIVKLGNYKANMLTGEEFIRFYNKFKENRFCLFNGDPHITYSEFIRLGKNEYEFELIYTGFD